jgi:hypothetical protein
MTLLGREIKKLGLFSEWHMNGGLMEIGQVLGQ